jgi:hypothetical protein
MSEDKKIPEVIVRNKTVTGALVVIDCPYCGKEHTHSRTDLGHRMAHCREPTHTGYILRREEPHDIPYLPNTKDKPTEKVGGIKIS